MIEANGFVFLVFILLAGVWLWLLFLVIKAGVRQGLREFLRDLSAVEEDRVSLEAPRRLDRLVVHLADLVRRRPPDDN